MLRAIAPTDENAQPLGLLSHHTSSTLNKENAVPFGSGPAGKAPSTRRVLGSLSSSNNSKQQSLSKPSLQQASTAAGGRRAFGDITNALLPKVSSEKSTDASKQLPLHVKKEVPAAPVVSQVKATTLDTGLLGRARRYAEGGVEKQAGRGWAQLEADRDRRIQQGISQRVKDWSIGLASWRAPCMVLASDDEEQQLQPEQEEVEPLPQLRPLKLRRRPASQQVQETCSLLLPDSPLLSSLPGLHLSSFDKDFAELI